MLLFLEIGKAGDSSCSLILERKLLISANTSICCLLKIKLHARHTGIREYGKISITMREENVRILLRIERKFEMGTRCKKK